MRAPGLEDELLIRTNAAEMIEEAGYEVVEAASADEAIAILERRLDITVVFTDIQMPGRWMVSSLLPRSGTAGRHKIVATSGHVKLGAGDLPQGGRFLPKPYSPAEITRILRELIAA